MTRFERWSVLISTALTILTGVGYFWTKYLVQPAGEWAVVNHPLQPWLLKAHIIVAPILVFSVGMISVRHVWQHFRSGLRWARKSGLSTMVAVAPMVLTGYLIQAFTDEGWLQAMAISHLAFSLVFTLGIGAHYWAVRRIGKRGDPVRQTRRMRIPSERAHVAHRPRGAR